MPGMMARRAVKADDGSELMKSEELNPWMMATLKEILLGAILRERVGDLTLRTGRAGMLRTFINTIRVEVGRWEPPVVDEDWHAVCQAICMGVEGVGELVPHVCGDEEGSPMFVTQVQVAGRRRFGKMRDAKRQR